MRDPAVALSQEEQLIPNKLVVHTEDETHFQSRIFVRSPLSSGNFQAIDESSSESFDDVSIQEAPKAVDQKSAVKLFNFSKGFTHLNLPKILLIPLAVLVLVSGY